MCGRGLEGLQLMRKSLGGGHLFAEPAQTNRTADVTTRDTIQGYFDFLKQKGAWDAFLADDMLFTSFTTPVKRVTGKGAYLEATKRFYSIIKALAIKGMVVEGERACVLTRYELQPPGAPVFESHVAEVFEVRDGKIKSLDIYFDSAPFPK